jgi:hypothetical protein
MGATSFPQPKNLKQIHLAATAGDFAGFCDGGLGLFFGDFDDEARIVVAGGIDPCRDGVEFQDAIFERQSHLGGFFGADFADVEPVVDLPIIKKDRRHTVVDDR